MDFDGSLKSAQASAVALAGTLLLAAAVGIGRFAYTPLLPPMQETLGWTVSQAGDVASSNFLGYMAGALAASGLAQRPERRLWLLVGMVLSAATTSAGVVVVSFPAWAGIRFLSGVASAICLVLGTAVVVEFLASHSQAQLGALHFSGVGGGIVASVLVIELARLAGSSVFVQWGALGLMSIALLAGSWMIIRRLADRPGSAESGALHASKRHAPTTRLLKKLITAYGLFGFGYVVTATFIVAMARRLDHAALLEPLTWIVVGLLAAPSVLAWQRLGPAVDGRMAQMTHGFEAPSMVAALLLMVGMALLRSMENS